MTYEPDYDVYDLTVGDGKYRMMSVIDRESTVSRRVHTAWRGGEWWQVGTNDLQLQSCSKWFSTLMTEFNTARAALRLLRHEITPGACTVTPEDHDIIALAFEQSKLGESK